LCAALAKIWRQAAEPTFGVGLNDKFGMFAAETIVTKWCLKD
jgi:hypothetical protein